MLFFAPGTSTPATVNAFGAVFTDVDHANTSSLQLFGTTGNPLGPFDAAGGRCSRSALGWRRGR